MGLNLNFSEKTSLNILANVARTVTMALVGILMVPYYVGTLGITAYAIIPLATTMSTYIQLISECIAFSSVRYSTLAFDRGDIDEANKTMSTTFFGLGKLYLLFLPVGLLLAFLSPTIFAVSSDPLEVQLLFAMIIISALLVTLSVPFNGVFFASNSLYLLYIAKFAYTVSQVLIIIVLFSIGTPSLVLIGIGYIVSSVLMFLLLYFLAKRSEKRMSIKRNMYDRTLFKKIGSLGLWSMLTNIGDLLFIQLSMVLVNLYMGTTSQGEFALIVTIISMMNTAVFTITDSVDALILNYYSKSDKEGLIHMLSTGMKMIAVIVAMPAAFLIAFAPEFLGAWVGSAYGHLSRLLTIGVLGNIAFCTLLITKNIPKVFLKVRIPTFITIIMAVLNVALTTWVLNSEYASIESAMTVWAFIMTALSVFNALYVAHITGAPKYLFPVWMAFGYAIIFVLYPLLDGLDSYLNVPPSWGPLLLLMGILFVFYFIVAYVLLFTRREKELIEKMLPERLSKHLPKMSLR